MEEFQVGSLSYLNCKNERKPEQIIITRRRWNGQQQENHHTPSSSSSSSLFSAPSSSSNWGRKRHQINNNMASLVAIQPKQPSFSVLPSSHSDFNGTRLISSFQVLTNTHRKEMLGFLWGWVEIFYHSIWILTWGLARIFIICIKILPLSVVVSRIL